MDNKLTACMVDDFLHDPALATRVIFGLELQPHLELRLWAMWNHKFCWDHSGFGMGKSLAIALVAALRGMLMQERVGGMISRTFGQGQIIYHYFDRWAQTRPIFRRELATNDRGEPDSVHGTAAWELTFRNGGRFRLIPPDFKGKAERAGSEDWQDGYFDEVTKYPDYALFVKQFFGRVRKPIGREYPKSDPIFDHHLFCAGTARYQWHPAFKDIQDYWMEIQKGNPQYMIQAWNCDHVPEEFKHLMEMDVIDRMRKTLPRDMVEQEIMGRWTRDSVGFYNWADIQRARQDGCPILLEAGT